MSYDNSIYRLKGMSSDELRILARKYIGDKYNDENMGKDNLAQELSKEAHKNSKLMLLLKKEDIKIKASFYFMLIKFSSKKSYILDNVRKMILKETKNINQKIKNTSGTHPTYKNIIMTDCSVEEGILIYLEFAWSKAYWYWNADPLERANTYEFNYGFSIINLKENKSIISCHSLQERDYLSQIIEDALNIKLSPLKLTKPLLYQIGDFSKVKKAGYVLLEKTKENPINIQYADEELSLKNNAKELEENSNAIRTHSFYQIPIGTIVEQGIGVTSETGKLWIPREIPINSIKDYCLELLSKVSSEMNKMLKKGEVDKLLETLGLNSIPSIKTIKNKSVRNEICSILATLVNMIIQKQHERVFEITEVIAMKMVPTYFNYPRLILRDDITNDVSFWNNQNKTSQLMHIEKTKYKLRLLEIPSEHEINFNNIYHPITGNKVILNNLLEELELLPTSTLENILIEGINHIETQLKLQKVYNLKIKIFEGKIILRLDNIFKDDVGDRLKDEIFADDISNFRNPIGHKITALEEKKFEKTVKTLKEKCNNMSDENCENCLSSKKYICIRSLVAFHLQNPELLSHKGIELCDLQGKVYINRDEYRIWCFSKLHKSRSGLTLRNSEGAVLLAQFINHLDKKDFTITGILTHSTINQDLRERFRYLCTLVNKSLFVIDAKLLVKMFVDYKENLELENININKLLSESYSKKKRKHIPKA